MMWRRVTRLAFWCRAVFAVFDLCVQKLGYHARHAAGGVLAHQGSKGGLGVVALEQRGHFNRLGRHAEFGARRSHLQTAHHVAANDGQQSHGAGANVRAELLLQHLEQIAFGQVHLKNRWELVVPHIAAH